MNIYNKTRYFTIITVIGSFMTSLLLTAISLFKLYEVIYSFEEYFSTGYGEKMLLVTLIETVDIFLLAVVFYIVSIGIYTLFINPNLQTPHWLNIRSINDLKRKLLNALVLVMVVFFVTLLANPQLSPVSLTLYGIGISLMIFAISYFLQNKN